MKKQIISTAIFLAVLVSAIAPMSAYAGGQWSTDVAITDIYAGNMPHGQFFVRITNHGPGTMHNVQVPVFCFSTKLDKNTFVRSHHMDTQIIPNVNLRPGETRAFATGISLDMNVYSYDVECVSHPGFNDPNMGNNRHMETLDITYKTFSP
mgnify:CR=1 FL=1|jgi:hypothetical protein